MPSIQLDEVRGPVIRHGDQRITPIARAARLSWRRGRVEWHHPLAVEIADGDGIRRIPVHDTTRRVMVGLFTAMLLAPVALGLRATWAERQQRQYSSPSPDRRHLQ